MAKLGIKKGDSATSKLAFDPQESVNYGLNKAVLAEVRCDVIKIGEDAKWEGFAGKEVPKLVFHFKSFDDVHERHHYHNISIVSAPDAEKEEMFVQSMLKTVWHMMEVLGASDELIEATLGEGCIDTGDGSPESLIKTYTAFFNAVAKVFMGGKNTTGLVMDKEGKYKKFWLKLIRDYKYKKGALAIPFFPGSGFMEIFKGANKPAIKIDVIKGETILEKSTKATSTVGAPAGAEDYSVPAALRGE